MALADHLVVMDHGRISDQGPPERVYRRPATRFAAAFLGDMTFLPAKVAGGMIHCPFGKFVPAGAVPDGSLLTLGLRPEHVGPGLPVALGPAEVVETQFQGMHRRVTVRPEAAPDRLVRALLPVGQDAVPGDTLALAFDPAHAVILQEPCP